MFQLLMLMMDLVNLDNNTVYKLIQYYMFFYRGL